MKLSTFISIIIIGLITLNCSGQEPSNNKDNLTTVVIRKNPPTPKTIIVGAENTSKYVPLLKDKKIGIIANHTSMIQRSHLVDSLLNLGLDIKRVFSPEHGFRGNADAGEKVESNIDTKTKLPIVSLYGNNKKPFPEQISDLDFVIFDIQDVGVRYYTYISTMHYAMEACAENNVKFMVLDRPNPNGHYVAGTILEKEHKSFVGMHPVPIVHGMTVGEYAQMINNEGWLNKKVKCDLTIIKTTNYNHNRLYKIPIKPSPNLPNMNSIYLYPSLCLFEGTPISVGRGTEKPFQVLGHPEIQSEEYSFTPKSISGAKKPKLLNEKCYGFDVSQLGETYLKKQNQLNLFWLLNIYKDFPKKDGFFTPMFTLLSGTKKLQNQIESGMTEDEIIASWQEGLIAFKKIRKQYLLYPDFE